jgi:hypothetical protein
MRGSSVVTFTLRLGLCSPATMTENMQWQTIEEAKTNDAYERKNC